MAAFKNYALATQQVTVPTGLQRTEIQAIDANGDGWLDVVVTSLAEPTADKTVPIVILKNLKNGLFADATSTLLSGSARTNFPREIVVADFNGDGRRDLFIADTGYDFSPFPGNPNTLLLGKAGGGFTNASSRLPHFKDYSHSADAGDIDGDDDLDIYVGNIHGGVSDPYFLINDGTAHFAVDKTRLPDFLQTRGETKTTSLFIDADHDGDLDLFLGSDGGGGKHSLLFNDGTGQFTLSGGAMPKGRYSEFQTVTVDARILDFDRDHLPDILAVETKQYSGAALQVLRSNGDGSFTDMTAEYIDRQPKTQAWIKYAYLVDLNSDGVVDIAGETESVNAFFYINDGSNHFFQLPASFIEAEGKIEVFDANHDGRNDVVRFAGNNGRFTLDVFVQQNGSGKTLTGSAQIDTLLGTNTSQTLSGLDGNDFVFGSGGKDRAIGGGGNDTVLGGNGADTVAGGLGKDTLAGGSQDDRFVFDSAPGSGNVDTIRDFVHGHDTISLDRDVFAKAGAKGGLAPARFYAADGATAAHDGNDRIIYNSANGKLFYDADGLGGKAPVLFAVLTGHPTLDAGDLTIV